MVFAGTLSNVIQTLQFVQLLLFIIPWRLGAVKILWDSYHHSPKCRVTKKIIFNFIKYSAKYDIVKSIDLQINCVLGFLINMIKLI